MMKQPKEKKNILHYAGLLVSAFFLTFIFFISAFYLYTEHTRSAGAFFSILCILFVIAFGVYLFFSLQEHQRTLDLEALRLQEKAISSQKQSISLSQKQMEKQFQDAEKKLMEIDRLLMQEDLERAQEVCHTFSSSFETERYQPFCNNDIIDIILHTKKSECAHLGIRFSFSLLLPEVIHIPDPELISLFFNLLNNGIEACESSGQSAPFIHLSVNYKGDFLSIRMENSKNPSISFQHTTTKEDRLAHGFGLSIIEEISRQRNGFSHWRDKGSSFLSEVLLQYS